MSEHATEYVVNNRTGEVHEANCPRVKVIASKSPWDPAKAALTPGVYADRICLVDGLPLRGGVSRPTTSEVIRQISDAVDNSYAVKLDPEAHMWRRLMKMVEESGEVVTAILGQLGENPRKGQTHSLADIEYELLDVALAALGARAFLGDPEPAESLDRHARLVWERLSAAIADG
jgi:hypothetical protein